MRALLGLLAVSCAARSPSIALAEEQLARAQPRHEGLSIDCAPTDAQVSIDGVPRGTCADVGPSVISVAPGRHRLEIRQRGYWPYDGQFDAEGTRLTLRVALVATDGEAR